MDINVPKEINGVYTFECGEDVYTYRTKNKREYSNEEFLNFLLSSHKTYNYYNEPCTMWNDYDGFLVMFPRDERADKKFLSNVILILEHTKSKEKQEIINKILNDCLIIDKEPELRDPTKKADFFNVKNFGEYHIDRYKLKDIYRDAINYGAHKYIKKFNYKNHYDKQEKQEIDLLTNSL